MTRIWRLAAGIFAAASFLSSQPVFRTGTRLVEVHVVVRDKQGPLTDLTERDFELYDQGHPQKIAFVRRVMPPAPDPGAAALPAGVVSNRTDASGNDVGNVTAILIDRLNTEIPDQIFAVQQVRSALRSR